ncbi:peptidylprolyl isomerase [Ruminiclostridium herbifermentans]|uniref:Peptidylprolyl isomerase n=1 Tax=Ruminiclostridium herbifermentans TaxID=2488810 RepID=A0A4U7JBC5_9FIRM|nr:peptidylprolyl isomerase [Ruminiclostridium herbifermentans]QNU67254.1 peptidylprolyl isomerase [Ruminiclostridium herbifermentans]
MTVDEQLNQINTAIAAIENGAQEYRIGSKQIRRADLNTLYQERRKLTQQLYEQNENSTYVAVFDRR